MGEIIYQHKIDGQWVSETIRNAPKVKWSRVKKKKKPKKAKPPAKKKKRTVSKTDYKFIISKKFLSSYEWRKLRMKAIKKYGRKCMCCGASPNEGAIINVDHIKPRKKFPELALDINNVQILCHECNHGKGNWDTTDWRPKEQGVEVG